MAPPSWGSSEQVAFLQSYLTSYLSHSAQRRHAKFWPIIDEAWFAKYPERDALVDSGKLPPKAGSSSSAEVFEWTAEQKEVLKKAIQKRKDVSVRQHGGVAPP